MKVVDSTFLIDVLKAEPDASRKAKELDEDGGAATTTINVYEVAYGVYKRGKDSARMMSALERLLQNLDIIQFDQSSAFKAAEISSNLDKRGEHIDPFDALMAGITLKNGAECIVTGNINHFKKVKGLKVEGY